MVLAIVWLSVTPHPPSVHVDYGDKLEHTLAYGVLMFWFCQIHSRRSQRAAYGLAWIVLGIALEYVQRLLGYRSFDVLDMAAGAAGVLLGWGMTLWAGTRLLLKADALISARWRV
jgi:VanZ family protein